MRPLAFVLIPICAYLFQCQSPPTAAVRSDPQMNHPPQGKQPFTLLTTTSRPADPEEGCIEFQIKRYRYHGDFDQSHFIEWFNAGSDYATITASSDGDCSYRVPNVQTYCVIDIDASRAEVELSICVNE